MAQDAGGSTPSKSTSYADRDLRISKENLYMVLALLMQDFPVERIDIDDYNRVGAVLVLPNDMSYAVDCSRNGVHGVARLLMAHPDTLQESKVFVSRKPCSMCTKLLVQSKVNRVFYLPIEPEYDFLRKAEEKYFDDETSRVDNLFKVSSIGQSVFVPRAGKDVTSTAESKKKTPKKEREEKRKELFDKYWPDKWMNDAQLKLPWPSFDVNMKAQVLKDFESITEWMAHVLVKSEMGNINSFESLAKKKIESFNPCTNNLERDQAIHLMKLAFFLAERTDDPRKGVGAVIVNKDKDIVALGWNGFPTKSLYGEFPRASYKDDEAVGDKKNPEIPEAMGDKKYPYIIHAEQNALLMRNTKNVVDATLIVTKTPCDECATLIEMQGIKTVVLGEKMQEDDPGQSKALMKFTKFPTRVKNESDPMVCFQPETPTLKRGADDSIGTSDSGSKKRKEATRNLEFEYSSP